MSNITSEIINDQTVIKGLFTTGIESVVLNRLQTSGLTEPKLSETKTAIVNGIKEQENIVIYNTIQDKLLNNFKIESLNIVTNVTQDFITKDITITKTNVIANKSFI